MHVSALALFFLFIATSRASAQVGCSLIDSSKPAQFLSYEMVEISEPTAASKENISQVILRFRNNSSCEVTVLTSRSDQNTLLLVPGESPRLVFVDCPDGKRIKLDYEVDYQPPLPPSTETPLLIDKINFEFRVPAGKSFTFTVPLFHFDHWVTVKVPFRYAWDTDTDRPAHRAIFGNLDLPLEIMVRPD